MEQTTHLLKQADADFRRLQKDQQLPPLMEIKLAFLRALIFKSADARDIGQRLQPVECQSIVDMSRQTQQKLFIDIVRCLSGGQSITLCKGQRAYIRREGKFFSWQKFYLSCDSNWLSFRKKRQSHENDLRFQLQKVSLSKYFKQYKGKQVVALEYEDLKYVVGFQQEATCERMHRMMSELIQQKRQWIETKFDNVHFLQQKEADRLALPAHKIQKIIDHEAYQYLQALERRATVPELNEQQGYRLHRTLQHGRILTAQDGTVKSQFLLKGITPIQVASCYLQMPAWNPAIEQFEITARPRRNCLLARMVTNKYSLFSSKREAGLVIHFFEPCRCKDSQAQVHSYLLIEDLPGQGRAVSGATKMNFKQIIEFLPNKEDPDLLLVIIFTEATFNGFCSEADNLYMTLHIVDQIQQLSSFTRQNLTAFSGYFESVPCPCGGQEPYELQSDISLPTEREQPFRKSGVPQSQKTMRLNYRPNSKRVLATLEDACRGVVNERMLELLKHREHQSYMIKLRSDEENECFRTFEGENRNFLGEGTRWQFEGEELKFIDVQVLSVQKDILKMILKQLSSNILSGKSIMNMSLPVEIFDKRSMLDAIADSYGFLAVYAPKIVATTDPVEQMKYMICAFMFLHATCPNVEKPFNPILGQTYQGKVGELPIYLQQISHHPPVSSLLIKNEGLEVWANVEVAVDMGLNSVHSYLCNWIKATVRATKTQYLIKLPDVYMEGMMYGDRVYKVINRGFILELSSSLFGEFSVGKNKKRVYQSKAKLHCSDVAGGIFKVKQEFVEKVKACHKVKSFEGVKPEYVVETCSLMSGKWYGDLYFDGVCYKSKKEGPFPFKAQKRKYLLPSDSIWREDLVFKIWGDNERSNREKERLQSLQRSDRKLREKYKKNR